MSSRRKFSNRAAGIVLLCVTSTIPVVQARDWEKRRQDWFCYYFSPGSLYRATNTLSFERSSAPGQVKGRHMIGESTSVLPPPFDVYGSKYCTKCDVGGDVSNLL